MKENKPDIRFEGFEEAWNSTTLGNLGYTYTGLSGKTKKDFGHGKANFVTYMNVFTNPIASASGVEHVEIDNSQNEVKKGDIFFTTSSETPDEVGMSSVWLYDMPNTYLNSFCFGFRPTELLDNFFAAYVLRSPRIRNDFYFLAQGISRFNISKQKAMDITVFKPSLKEQEKVGEFFRNLDELIEAKEQELEKLRHIKLALLDKMFPSDEPDNTNWGGYNRLINSGLLMRHNLEILPSRPNTPAIRFRGFTEPWELKSFRDFGYVSMCKRILKSQTSTKGDVPFFKIGTFGNIPDSFISYDLYSEYSQKYPFPRKGDILISAAGTIGRVVEYDGQKAYFQDSNIVWLNHNDDLDNSFLKILYSIVHWNGLEGSTLKRLYNNNLLNTTFYIPSPNEQKKIGEFFKEQDDNIANAQLQIIKLRNIKQALMERMFA